MESDAWGGYLSAVERLSVALCVTIPEGQALTVCVRLHAHGCTPLQAGVIADLLSDDVSFCEGVTRYKSPMTAGHWIAKLATLPRPGGRYSEADVHHWQSYGFPRSSFPRTLGDPLEPKPYGYVHG